MLENIRFWSPQNMAIACALIILQLLLFLSVDVFFPFPKLGQLSNAFRWSAGFGLCSYFAVRLLC